MNRTTYFATLAALMMAALLVSQAVGEGIKADRSPLTYRDSGLYTRVNSIHGPPTPQEDGLNNLLSPERAASVDSPWSFYIFQHNGPANAKEITLLRQMAGNGKKAILRVHLGKLEKTTAAENIDAKEQHLVEMLAGIDPDWLYAITLDEERVYWDGWAEVLTGLYHRAKQRWPDLPVYQWWTPMEVPNARTSSGWGALPADGWVIDLYGRSRTVFEKKLVMALETGKPVIHIVWSSPTWKDLTCMGAASWEEGGRQIFDDQLDVCRGYNVPVAHFCTQPQVYVDGEQVAGFRWGWHSVEPELRQWYRYLEVLAENNRRLPEQSIGFRRLDKALFDWAHGSDASVGLVFSLDALNRTQIALAADLGGIPLEAGEHSVDLGEANRYLKLTCLLDESAANLEPGLGISGKVGGSVTAVVIFRIDPQRPISGLDVTGDMTVIRALGGGAQIALSGDGKEWSEPVSATGDSTRSLLRVHAPGHWRSRFSDQSWYVRVYLSANSGSVTRTAAKLNHLRISAAVEPPRN